MGTKANPGKYDCYNKAFADEPRFTLLARDWTASYLVHLWAAIRRGDLEMFDTVMSEIMKELRGRMGSPVDVDQTSEAIRTAAEMRFWFNGHKNADTNPPRAQVPSPDAEASARHVPENPQMEVASREEYCFPRPPDVHKTLEWKGTKIDVLEWKTWHGYGADFGKIVGLLAVAAHPFMHAVIGGIPNPCVHVTFNPSIPDKAVEAFHEALTAFDQRHPHSSTRIIPTEAEMNDIVGLIMRPTRGG